MARNLQLDLKHLVGVLAIIFVYVVWLYPFYRTVVSYNNARELGNQPLSVNAVILSAHKQHTYFGIIGDCVWGVEYRFYTGSKFVTNQDKIECSKLEKPLPGGSVQVQYNKEVPERNISVESKPPTLTKLITQFMFGVSLIFIMVFAYHYWHYGHKY